MGADGQRADATADDGVDPSVARNAADAGVAEVGEDQVAQGGEAKAIGSVQKRLTGEAAVAGVAGEPRASQSANNARRIDAAEAVVIGIGEIDVAIGIGNDALKIANGGLGGAATVTGRGAAGKRANAPRGRALRRQAEGEE